jgi:hypothetical protein
MTRGLDGGRGRIVLCLCLSVWEEELGLYDVIVSLDGVGGQFPLKGPQAVNCASLKIVHIHFTTWNIRLGKHTYCTLLCIYTQVYISVLYTQTAVL